MNYFILSHSGATPYFFLSQIKKLSTCCPNLTSYLSHNNRLEILNKLNSSSETELATYKLSPILIKKIINEKRIIGTFNVVSEVRECGLDDDKLKVLHQTIWDNDQSPVELQEMIASPSKISGHEDLLKSYPPLLENEEICPNIDGKHKLKIPPSLMNKNSSSIHNLISNFRNRDEKLITFTALSITFSQMTWTTMTSNNEIIDMSCAELISDGNKKLSSLHIREFYDKLKLGVCQIPKSDIFIFESHFPSVDSSANRLHWMLKGILLALMDTRQTNNDPHPLVFIEKNAVSKIFNLMVGSERTSGSAMGESILAGKPVLKWIKPVSFARSPLQKFILCDYSERRQMVEALLLAIAFYSVFLKKYPTQKS